MGYLHRLRRAQTINMNWRNAKTSAWLCLLFVFVYGTTNWLASLHGNVRGVPFAWERHIPFVPLMIVPYMSIDLFFVAAPLFCIDVGQCRTLARRLGAAIVIAGACFFLMPMRFSFERPHVNGWMGVIFDNFRALDRPYNQFPSLHIALGVILAVHYWERLRGIAGAFILVWFAVILASTLLTYQHHFIDIFGGAMLAIICLHLFQNEPEPRAPGMGNTTISSYYLAGAVIFTIISAISPPWSLLLLCPAISSGLIGYAYLGFGAEIYRKKNGQLPLSTRLLLWPVLAAHHISWIYYARQCRAWDPLSDCLWIGRRLNRTDASAAVAGGVTAVLDLTAEFSEVRELRNLTYWQLPILDLTAPTLEQLADAVEWIRRQSTFGIVYLHCKAGYSRTAAVAGAFLLACGEAETADEAIQRLRAARPSMVIRPEAAAAIRAFEKTLDGQGSAKIRVPQ